MFTVEATFIWFILCLCFVSVFSFAVCKANKVVFYDDLHHSVLLLYVLYILLSFLRVLVSLSPKQHNLTNKEKQHKYSYEM